VISRVAITYNPSYILVRSSTVGVASSDFRSLSRFTCFQITFKHSAKAMSTVWSLCPFFKASVMFALASFEPGSLRTSFASTLESRISFGVLGPP
jgi:hypothetical protein